MTLQTVLWFKICCTVGLWCGPMLRVPARCWIRFGVPVHQTIVFVRLLGAAYTALVLGYGLALHDLYQHEEITEVVRNVIWVGIASNGLACLIIVSAGSTGGLAGWGRWARRAMWLSAVLTGAITIGLVWTGLFERL